MKTLLVLLLATFNLWAASRLIKSGSQSDIQAAIDAAGNGSTVIIPAGRWTWTDTLKVNKAISLVGEAGTVILNGHNVGVLIEVTAPATLQGLTIEQGNTTPDWSVKHLVVYAPGTLIKGCNFSMSSHGARMIEWETNGGVISQCSFTSTQKADTSGIAFKALGLTNTWMQASSIGMTGDPDGTKNTYLEDCTFKDLFLQALDFDDNSRTVVRHCTFDNSGTTSHGADTSPSGMRQIEMYDNEFIFTIGGGCNPNPYPLNLNYWFYVRGGIGVITDNVMPSISSCAWGDKGSISLTVYNIRRNGGQVPCQTSYPALHQIGQGPEGTTDPLYIWNNTGSGAAKVGLINYNPDECGNNLQTSDFLREGRDYVLSARPNYQKYTYPHPLAGKPPKPTPTPTPTPAPTATPTPTPAPSPTPTPPTSSESYSHWLDELARWIEDHPPRAN
jgi:hypothetical protein